MIYNVLYKKTYKHMTYKDYQELFTSITPEDKEKTKKLITKYKEYDENLIYVKIPEKDALMRPFVQGAINFSNDLSVDVEISQKDDRITVCFSFEDVEVFTGLKDVINLSDEIVISQNENKLVFELDFITHTPLFKNG